MNYQRRLPPDTDIVAYLRGLDPATRCVAVGLLPELERETLDRAWPEWAHDGQLAPVTTTGNAPWSTWVIKAGRGFGKTLAGAQWVTSLVAEQPVRVALVGSTIDDARRVMVDGPSGLLTVAGQWIEDWQPSINRLRFLSGAEATIYSGATPHLLRGPEHHFAWCDELAKWAKAQETWDMLQLGLRLGQHPQALVTTTPAPGPVLRAIMDDASTVVTGGKTADNPHLAPAYQQRVHKLYGGTRLGRQELDGELLPDAAGALWSVELIERCRGSPLPGAPHLSLPRKGGGADFPPPLRGRDSSRSEQGEGVPPFTRTLIAVDPPSSDGTCGIIACARSGHGNSAVAHVLADHSVTGRSPEGWATAVAAAAAAHGTSEIIAEANQGGKMVKAVLSAANPGLRVKLVHASVGKTTRAEPVAHLFEAGRVWLHGRMPELEAQLQGMIAGGGYEGPGRSPDRADAMVWGVGEVMKEVRVGVWVG